MTTTPAPTPPAGINCNHGSWNVNTGSCICDDGYSTDPENQNALTGVVDFCTLKPGTGTTGSGDGGSTSSVSSFFRGVKEGNALSIIVLVIIIAVGLAIIVSVSCGLRYYCARRKRLRSAHGRTTERSRESTDGSNSEEGNAIPKHPFHEAARSNGPMTLRQPYPADESREPVYMEREDMKHGRLPSRSLRSKYHCELDTDGQTHEPFTVVTSPYGHRTRATSTSPALFSPCDDGYYYPRPPYWGAGMTYDESSKHPQRRNQDTYSDLKQMRALDSSEDLANWKCEDPLRKQRESDDTSHSSLNHVCWRSVIGLSVRSSAAFQRSPLKNPCTREPSRQGEWLAPHFSKQITCEPTAGPTTVDDGDGVSCDDRDTSRIVTQAFPEPACPSGLAPQGGALEDECSPKSVKIIRGDFALTGWERPPPSSLSHESASQPKGNPPNLDLNGADEDTLIFLVHKDCPHRHRRSKKDRHRDPTLQNG